jgi:hypothetical protein
MHVSKVTYRANNPQPGYKTAHAEVTVDVAANENPLDAIAYAKDTVQKALGLDLSEEQVLEAEKTISKARKLGLR